MFVMRSKIYYAFLNTYCLLKGSYDFLPHTDYMPLKYRLNPAR